MTELGKGGSSQGKQRNTGKSSRPSGPTKAERLKQSRDDKAKNQALVAAAALAMSNRGPRRQRQNQRRPTRDRGGYTLAGPGPVKRFLASLRRGMPSAVPTRVEVLHFRARYSLTHTHQHMVLFHPAHSLSLGLLTSFMTEGRDLTTFPRGTAAVPVAWGAGVDLTASIAECMGIPGALVSSVGRVTGGVMTIKVTGCEGSSGYAVSSCPMRTEIQDHKALYDTHSTSIRLKRHDIGAGTKDFAFHAPILSAAAMETFTGVNMAYHWSEADPFGGVVVTFHDLQYNEHQGMPFIVELDMQVGIECKLPLDDRHLATTHGSEKVAVKADIHNEKGMGHIITGKGASSQAVQQSATVPAGGGR